MRRAVLMLLAAACAGVAVLAHGQAAAAHPLGNFTVNRYARLDLTPGVARVLYVLDMAEVPAFQERAALDTDRDGRISDVEAAAWAATTAESIRRNLAVQIGGRAVELRTVDQRLSFPPGQGGLETLRLELRLEGVAPAVGGRTEASLRDGSYTDRIGWKELVVRGGPGIDVLDSTVKALDTSDALRAYPEDLLQSPLNQREARFALAPGAGMAWDDAPLNAGTVLPARGSDRFAALLTRELTLPLLALSLLIALGLGAMHALGPGHGKTVVAAYLVGSRGTAKHALFLGLTVTATHTSSVFALGLVTLYLSEYILPERLFPWLSFASGASIALLGFVLLVGRVRGVWRGRAAAAPGNVHVAGARMRAHHAEHDHGGLGGHSHSHGGRVHSHAPPGARGERVSWRSLLALGISGGILPCPSALVVLLTAISLHRIAYGMLLIVAFSVGLAAVLTGIGILLVHARALFSRVPFDSTLARLMPVLSALVVTALGCGVAARALSGGFAIG